MQPVFVEMNRQAVKVSFEGRLAWRLWILQPRCLKRDEQVHIYILRPASACRPWCWRHPRQTGRRYWHFCSFSPENDKFYTNGSVLTAEATGNKTLLVGNEESDVGMPVAQVELVEPPAGTAPGERVHHFPLQRLSGFLGLERGFVELGYDIKGLCHPRSG